MVDAWSSLQSLGARLRQTLQFVPAAQPALETSQDLEPWRTNTLDVTSSEKCHCHLTVRLLFQHPRHPNRNYTGRRLDRSVRPLA
jgi:hypothetical protein